jgi:hypothetical protein
MTMGEHVRAGDLPSGLSRSRRTGRPADEQLGDPDHGKDQSAPVVMERLKVGLHGKFLR